MADIQNTILEDFCAKLSQTNGFTQLQVDQIRDLFTAGKKPKSSELIKILLDRGPLCVGSV